MNTTTLKKVTATVALMVISLITIGSANTASAQGRRFDRDRWEDRWDRWDDRNDRRDERRGFRDGYEEGRDDARKGHRFDFDDNKHYRNGNRDYREGFRKGYINAFREFRNRRW